MPENDPTDFSQGYSQPKSTVYKRKRDSALSPVISEHHKKYVWEEASLIKQNKYYLPDEIQSQMDNTSSSSSTTESPKSKIPPIFIHNATNYKVITDDIKSVISNDSFTTQCKSNSIRINLTTSTDFRKLTEFYDQKGIQYHTFSNPDASYLSVVIRNIPVSISSDEIKEELTKTYPVEKVTRLLNKDKLPIPLCVVDLKREEKADDIFNLTKFGHSIISVEPRRKSRDIPQCTRCQRYGHTKNYCKLQPRCVKCSQNHHYSQCPKKPEETPSCVNCGENHTANYRGCSYYAKLKSRVNIQQQQHRSSNTSNNTTNHRNSQTFVNSNISSHSPTFTSNTRPRSYANATKNDQTPISNVLEIIMQYISPYIDQIKQFIFSLVTSMFNGNVQHG